jgi:hypothetical protein
MYYNAVAVTHPQYKTPKTAHLYMVLRFRGQPRKVTKFPPPNPERLCWPPLIPPPIIPLPMALSREATSRKSSNNRVIPLPCPKEASPFPRLLRFFAANPVNCSGPQFKPRQLVAPTHPAMALRRRKPWRSRLTFRAASQLFLIYFHLHARHFTSPGWTSAVQPKLFLGGYFRSARPISMNNNSHAPIRSPFCNLSGVAATAKCKACISHCPFKCP